MSRKHRLAWRGQKKITLARVLTQYVFNQRIARPASCAGVTGLGNLRDCAQSSRSDLALNSALRDPEAGTDERLIPRPFFPYCIAIGLDG